MKFKLTRRELSELIGEGVLTVVLLLMINISIFEILDTIISTNPELANGIFQIKSSVTFGRSGFKIWSWGWVYIGLTIVLDTGIVYWRLVRRYHQMQLRHIINELHYIADNHFNHRIGFTLNGQMQRVVESVNALVDSTIKAMEDERQIERSKDELITNVSHDIRTPLTSIIGYLGLIENKQYNSQDDIINYSHIAFLKSKQMKSLVDDLFEYTKVRQIDAKLNTMTISLNSLLEQVEVSFELEAQKKNMQLHVELPQHDIKMEADPEKLVRVFNNLVTNALKYGHGGKNIYLKADTISDKEIKVSVSNDGEPIPKKSLNQVFERFYRVESSRSKETGGTGLGLAITQSIVELHHGYIYVESDDKLTSFIIHLPISQKDTIKNIKN